MIETNRIAILEDSLELQSLMTAALSNAGYEVKTYGRAMEFEMDLPDWQPELCIIDLGLPDKDGLGVLSNLTQKSDTAVLVVSGRSSLSDKIAGLELGADDYLPKPFEMPELIARIRALIRRKTAKDTQKSDIYKLCNWTVDVAKFLLIDEKGHEEQLSASEIALLKIFLNRPNYLITRDQLREELDSRSNELSFDRAIDVRISRLRAKLKDSSKDPKIIKTIYGAGYILISK